MLTRFRTWFAEAPLAVAITVGVVGGYVLFLVLGAAVGAFVYPILLRLRSADTTDRLSFHWGRYVFDYSSTVIYAIAALVLAAIAYMLFAWRGDGGEEMATRECPACKNHIWADATRCGFCTSVVEPLPEPPSTATATPSETDGLSR